MNKPNKTYINYFSAFKSVKDIPNKVKKFFVKNLPIDIENFEEKSQKWPKTTLRQMSNWAQKRAGLLKSLNRSGYFFKFFKKTRK